MQVGRVLTCADCDKNFEKAIAVSRRAGNRVVEDHIILCMQTSSTSPYYKSERLYSNYTNCCVVKLQLQHTQERQL